MERLMSKRAAAERRDYRVRMTVRGTTQRPRLAVSVSNLHITAQVIDDETGRTLAYATSVGQKLTGTMTDKAAQVGVDIAKKAKAKKVTTVVFDRSGRKYHGRLKALADAARENGLEF
jgi:large subunit ribosomal protein L18